MIQDNILKSEIGNIKKLIVNIANDVASFQHFTLVSNDQDLKANRTSTSLVVMLRYLGGFQGNTSVQLLTQFNNNLSGNYGSGLRSSSSEVVAFACAYDLGTHTPSSSTTNSMSIDTGGNLKYTISSSYPLRAGNYEILIKW